MLFHDKKKYAFDYLELRREKQLEDYKHMRIEK